MTRQVLTIRVAVDLLVCPKCSTSGLCEPFRLDRIIDPASAGVEADYSSSEGLPRGWGSFALLEKQLGTAKPILLCPACSEALRTSFVGADGNSLRREKRGEARK